MNHRRLTALLIAVTLLTGLFSVPAAAVYDGGTAAASTKTFTDVPATHWAHEAISWMAGQGILNGVGDGTFRPDDAVTREQFARIMVAALQLQVGSSYPQSFSDVLPGSWSFKYVEAAKPYLTGYDVVGRDMDLFLPLQPAVREDMAVALVKALALQDEEVDLSVLEAFSDHPAATGGISPNLVPYVAIAVKNNILTGAAREGGLYFDAQKTLTRAQASVLVFRSLAVAGEKVTYDDLPKVTYSDDPCDSGCEEETPSVLAATNAKAVVSGSKVIVSWDKIDVAGFQGYKVVLSKADSTPVYPENGYYRWITDRNTTSVDLTAGQIYSGGDLGGKLQSGVKYYLSITAVHDGGKKAGNTITVTLPAAPATTPPPSATISAIPVTGGIKLSWTKITDARFSGYKVVLSKSDSDPRYPEDGYLAYITNPAENYIMVTANSGYNGTNDFNGDFLSGQTYHARITTLYTDGKTHGNVIQVTIP